MFLIKQSAPDRIFTCIVLWQFDGLLPSYCKPYFYIEEPPSSKRVPLSILNYHLDWTTPCQEKANYSMTLLVGKKATDECMSQWRSACITPLWTPYLTNFSFHIRGLTFRSADEAAFCICGAVRTLIWDAKIWKETGYAFNNWNRQIGSFKVRLELKGEWPIFWPKGIMCFSKTHTLRSPSLLAWLIRNLTHVQFLLLLLQKPNVKCESKYEKGIFSLLIIMSNFERLQSWLSDSA